MMQAYLESKMQHHQEKNIFPEVQNARSPAMSKNTALAKMRNFESQLKDRRAGLMRNDNGERRTYFDRCDRLKEIADGLRAENRSRTTKKVVQRKTMQPLSPRKIDQRAYMNSRMAEQGITEKYQENRDVIDQRFGQFMCARTAILKGIR